MRSRNFCLKITETPLLKVTLKKYPTYFIHIRVVVLKYMVDATTQWLM